MYPCHRFAGIAAFRAGHVAKGTIDPAVRARFGAAQASGKAPCAVCWAASLCGGGCAYRAFAAHGAIECVDTAVCASIRGNVEHAARTYLAQSDAEKIETSQLSHAAAGIFSYWSGHEGNAFPGRFLLLQSKGESMLPLIRPDAVLQVELVHPRHIRIGDVFCYRAGRKTLTHRVLAKLGADGAQVFLEKGDNGYFAEARASDVVGRLVAVRNRESACEIRLDRLGWRVTGLLLVGLTYALWAAFFFAVGSAALLRGLVALRGQPGEALRAALADDWFQERARRFNQWASIPIRRVVQWAVAAVPR